MLIHEKYKNIKKKRFNPPFKGINPEKWPKIQSVGEFIITRELHPSAMPNHHSVWPKWQINLPSCIPSAYQPCNTGYIGPSLQLTGIQNTVFEGFEVPKKVTLKKIFSHLDFCHIFLYKMGVHSMYLISVRGIFDMCPVRTSRQLYFWQNFKWLFLEMGT